MVSIRELHPFDTAIAEAERCKNEARSAVKQNPDKYAQLKDQPAGWCVVTRKGLWTRVYHNVYGEPKLKEVLDRGHEVLLAVGIVARPDAPLNPESHVASVHLVNPGGLSEYKLHLIAVRAKLHAAQALHN